MRNWKKRIAKNRVEKCLKLEERNGGASGTNRRATFTTQDLRFRLRKERTAARIQVEGKLVTMIEFDPQGKFPPQKSK